MAEVYATDAFPGRAPASRRRAWRRLGI